MPYIPTFADNPMWYAGLIWAIAMGWAASSYASNFSYRIPRGETPFGREPYCGDCNSSLTPRDLFPVFSWLMTGGKCRHCGAQVPASYFLLELLYAPYIGLCYMFFGFGDMFILTAFLGMLLQISAMMVWDDDYTSPTLNIILLAMGLMFQLLQGNMLLDGLLGVFFAMFAALFMHGIIERKPPEKDVYAMPKWVWLVAASGAWLATETALIFVPILIGLTLIGNFILKDKPLASLIAAAQAPALLLAVWWGLFT